MARKNYAFGAEKRRKELDRQKKREEKRARKRNKQKADENIENPDPDSK